MKNEAVLEVKLKSISPENSQYDGLVSQQQHDIAILKAHKGTAIERQIHDAQKSMSNDLQTYGKNSFVYRRDSLEYNMLKALPFIGNGVYLGVGMQIAMFFSTYSPVIFGAVILFGLSTVFSEEYGLGMDNLLLTSKWGKRTLVTAKFLASAIYILVMESILEVVNLGGNLIIFGGKGLNYPLQSLAYNYATSPFHLSVLQYFVIALFIQLIGCLTSACIVLLFSCWNRSSLVSFILSGGTFMLPFLINRVISAQWAQTIQTFSYMSLIQVEPLFKSFTAYNFLDYPVSLPFAVISVLALITVPLICLTYFSYNRHQVI